MLAAKTGTPSCRTATSQRWILAFALVAVADATPGTAQAKCTILESLPATINAPGNYCLDEDFASTQGVLIQASNVLIDCRGHAIEASTGTSSAIGVNGLIGARNLTVRNCRIAGFSTGIGIDEDAVVEDNQIARSGIAGISVSARSLVRRNRVFDTGSPENNPSGVARGIIVTSGSEVVENIVDGVVVGTQPRNASGIVSLGALNPAVPGGNTIRGNVVRDIQGTTAHAILGAPRDVIRDNQVINTIKSTVAGIFAPGALCRDNDIVGFTGPSGCSATSGNLLLP